MYAHEVATADQLGIAQLLIHFETILHEQDVLKAVRRVEATPQEDIGISRGWMLRPEQCTYLYEVLTEHGIRLLNSPTAHLHCHYLPELYVVIEDYTLSNDKAGMLFGGI